MSVYIQKNRRVYQYRFMIKGTAYWATGFKTEAEATWAETAKRFELRGVPMAQVPVFAIGKAMGLLEEGGFRLKHEFPELARRMREARELFRVVT